MLPHARLTTIEVPLSEAFNPPPPALVALLFGQQWELGYLKQPPGVNVFKNTGGKQDLCSKSLFPVFIFLKRGHVLLL